MSADNGIYILETPAPPIKEGCRYTNQRYKSEYRVAHCTNIENIDYSHLYWAVYFGESQIFLSRDTALKRANELHDSIGHSSEYGICWITKHQYFPNITPAAAAHALDAHVGATRVYLY